MGENERMPVERRPTDDLDDQSFQRVQQTIQKQLTDLGDEFMNLARLLDQNMTALQILQAGPAPAPAGRRALAEAFAQNRRAAAQLQRIQQGLTQLRVSLDHVPPASAPVEQDRERLRILFKVSQTLNSTLDLNALLNLAIDMVIETTHAERGFLMLYENSSAGEPVLTSKVARNVDHQTIAGPSFEISRSIVSQVADTGQPVLTTNAQTDPRFDAQASVLGYGLRSILCAALLVKDRVTGVIYVDSRIKAGLFSLRDLDFLVALANQAAMAIENARLYQAVSSGYFDTIKALAATIDAKDPRTFGHSDRVTRYAVQMAEALQLLAVERETLRYAAILHDIGKIGVDDAILRKPGHLTPEEEDIIYSHPVIGTLIIDGIAFLKEARPLIRHHHERWDGQGYPDGLAGEDIPLGARILNIADAYDVMVSGRPYREPIGVVDAVAELRTGTGTQFDPVLVDVFIREVASQFRRR